MPSRRTPKGNGVLVLASFLLAILVASLVYLSDKHEDGVLTGFVLIRPPAEHMSGNRFVVATELLDDDGLLVEGDEHMIVTCPDELRPGYRRNTPEDIVVPGLLAYEFREDFPEKEGEWTGKRYGYGQSPIDTLTHFLPGRRYYVSGNEDFFFSCQSAEETTPIDPLDCDLFAHSPIEGNDPPVLQDGECSFSAMAGIPLSLTFNATDPEGDDIRFAAYPLSFFLDIDRDGRITIADQQFIHQRIGDTEAYDIRADLNGDGLITPLDFLIWSNEANAAHPSGLQMNEHTGVLTWTPSEEQVGVHYLSINAYTPSANHWSPYSAMTILIVVSENDGTVPPSSSSSPSPSSSSSSSHSPVCGNGILEPGEQCDDGNTDDGDGCFSTCMFMLPPETP